ncbi:MAG: hypothetical protein IBX60_06185 [Candidatus Aminicenantes bacterium]|nr:hypothetical protein [Candidatus Aminicenantes bacterium]
MKKSHLKDYILNYAKSRYYFNLQDLRNYLMQNGIDYTEENLKKSIYRTKRNKIIYGSGRGWYSTIREEFVLDTKPIERIIKLINKDFPFLKFCCWSTEQLKAFFHHLPTQFVTFIYSEKDFLSSLKDFVENNDYNVFLNPQKNEAEKFVHFRNQTVILRPSITYREPKDQHVEKIEKIIVDLYMEVKKINLIDMEEYKKIVLNIVSNHRVNMSELLDYAHNRKVRSQIEHIIMNFNVSTNATFQ